MKYIHLTLSLTCTCLAGLALSSCRPAYQRYTGFIMGTTFHIQYARPDTTQTIEIEEAVYRRLQQVNARFSNWLNDSELSRLSEAPAGLTKTSEQMTRLLSFSRRLSEQTGGAFDITLAPVVALYGFEKKENALPTLPPPARLKALRPLIGFGNYSVDEKNNTVTRSRPVKINLSSIAKGYAVDEVAVVLAGFGIKNYFVEVGGEIRVKGLNGREEPWRVGINTPSPQAAAGDVLYSFSPGNGAVATSGTYRNFMKKDGRIIHHLIDGRTLRPAENRLVSVSIYAPDCMQADALATAVHVSGLQAGRRLLKEHYPTAAMFAVRLVEGRFEAWFSENWPGPHKLDRP